MKVVSCPGCGREFDIENALKSPNPRMKVAHISMLCDDKDCATEFNVLPRPLFGFLFPKVVERAGERN